MQGVSPAERLRAKNETLRKQIAEMQPQQTPRTAPEAELAAKAVAEAPAAKVRPQAPAGQSQQTPRMAPKAPSASKATPVAPPERGEAHRLLWTLTSSISK